MSQPAHHASMRLAAPAKLNLSLRITARRADGFHELEGLFVLLELADDLRLVPGDPGFRVANDQAMDVPANPADNLAWRGLLAGVGDAASEVTSAGLTLTKRVPVAAGLGGGSSDAAAGWRLGRRWRGAAETPTEADLADLGRIGADVPFFAAQAAAAWVTGIGEHVERRPLPAAACREVLLVHPPFGLSTAAVFAELRTDEWGAATSGRDPFRADAGNDLLAPARRLRPELDDLRHLVSAAGVEPRLTGSGPTLFALLDDPERADAAGVRLAGLGVRTSRTRLRDEPATIETP